MTSQGQVSVPAAVRKALGVEPGSVLEWTREGETIVVRKAGEVTFADVRRALLGNKKIRRRTLKELKAAIPDNIRKRHPRPPVNSRHASD